MTRRVNPTNRLLAASLAALALLAAGTPPASGGLPQVEAVVDSVIAPSTVPFPSSLTIGGERGAWNPSPPEWLGDDGLPTAYAYAAVLILRAALAAKDLEVLEQAPVEPEGSRWLRASWPEPLPATLERRPGALHNVEEFLATVKPGSPCVELYTKMPWGWHHYTTTMDAGWFAGTLDLIERAARLGRPE
ncbi:MAG: hypothetical protein K6T75_05485 [Acetobacteraceae bacterium]|nr:hypothetical protein [Acetobacteraceae bacterium]